MSCSRNDGSILYSVHILLAQIVGNLVIPAVGLPVGVQQNVLSRGANSQVGNRV